MKKNIIEKHLNYALINRARGAYEEIFVLTFEARTKRSEVHVP